MNNQTIFLVIIVLILIFCLPKKQISQISQISQIPKIPQISQIMQTPQIQQKLSKIIDQTTQFILPTTREKKIESKNIINEYLNKNECNENFDTMGSNMDMGNNMNFKQNINPNPSSLSKALSKSLVPDFQPNYLNINPELNSYGYSTTNPEADKYYMERGFMNPEDGSKFADSVSYMLSHPYQTKYCDNNGIVKITKL